MEESKIIDVAKCFSREIARINKEYQNKRIENKENFNLFSAIVSGKNDKTHIEKYHSNLLAYLLDPNGSHDFGTLFLEYFFDKINELLSKKCALPSPNVLFLEREKQTTEGRFIDITLESSTNNDWIIFIENKILSGEQPSQMKDYIDFADENFKNAVGIYLTLRGDKPQSIDNKSEFKGSVIAMSYIVIIEWLKKCCEDERIKAHSHIQSILKQYIEIINNLLGNMKEVSKKINILLKKSDKEDVATLIENQSYLREAITDLIKEIRDKFKYDLDVKCKKTKEETSGIPEALTIEIVQGDYLFSGNEDNSFGLGFTIKKEGEKFNYGGGGDGGHGNGIFINEVNAHYGNGIEKSNIILWKAFNNEDEWNKIVNESVEKIFKEIENNVLPKFK